jgi:hypothetical protein
MEQQTKEIIKLHIKLRNLADEAAYLKMLLNNVNKIKPPTDNKRQTWRTVHY